MNDKESINTKRQQRKQYNYYKKIQYLYTERYRFSCTSQGQTKSTMHVGKHLKITVRITAVRTFALSNNNNWKQGL